MKSGKKAFLSIVMVLFIIVIIIGMTFAYFSASSDANNEISGSSININYEVNATSVYDATKLIPLKSNKIDTAVKKSAKCVDNKSQDVCSLYQVTLTNSGEPVNLYGFIRTNTSTYITSNLKYKVYDSSFNAISDVMSVSNVDGDSVYFKYNGSNVNISLSTATLTYYVVFWIEEQNAAQDNDQNKTFNFKIGFEGSSGSVLSASFNV